MNGDRQSFSGVINCVRVKNPINLAEALQTSDDRVLSDNGAIELLRELGVPIFNPMTDERLYEWIEERKTNFSRKMAGVAMSPSLGTIGVVALDCEGRLCAGTSTGGRGFERIGRVSDSAMPAGNYATKSAAVSCTGVGEDIIDECLAAKIVVRVTDGMSLAQAVEKSFAEAESRKRDFGAICLDATGAIAWGKTTSVLFAAYHDGDAIGDTL
jgi:L-asparaginase